MESDRSGSSGLTIRTVPDEVEEEPEVEEVHDDNGPAVEIVDTREDATNEIGEVLSKYYTSESIQKFFEEEFYDNSKWVFGRLAVLAGALLGLGWFFTSIILAYVIVHIYSASKDAASERKVENFEDALRANPTKEDEFLSLLNVTSALRSKHTTHDETFKWLNNLIAKVWPFVNSLVQNEIDNSGLSLKGIHQDDSNLVIERFSLGDQPPRINNLTINQLSRDDELVIDFNVAYYGNCLASFSYTAISVLSLHAGFENIFIQSRMRLYIRPLLKEPPYFGGIVVCFTKRPIMDFDAFSLASIADTGYVKDLIIKGLTGMLVEPNRLYLAKSLDMPKENLRRVVAPEPMGLCCWQIIEARDLKKMDFTITGGSSDPRCIIKTGDSLFKSPVVHGSVNPVWNFERVTPIHDLNATFIAEVFDKDLISNDDFLGEVSLRLSSIIESKNGSDRWLQVTTAHGSVPGQGHLHLRIACFELQNKKDNLKKTYKDTLSKLPRSILLRAGLVTVWLHHIQPSVLLSEDNALNLQIYLLISYYSPELSRPWHFYSTSALRPGPSAQKIDDYCRFACRNPNQDVLAIYAINRRHISVAAAKSKIESKSKPLDDNDYVSMYTLPLKDLITKPNFEIEDDLHLAGDIVAYNFNAFIGLQVCAIDDDVLKNMLLPLKPNPPTN